MVADRAVHLILAVFLEVDGQVGGRARIEVLGLDLTVRALDLEGVNRDPSFTTWNV